jgi:tetratricopeptide (TPR) repeat protein
MAARLSILGDTTVLFTAGDDGPESRFDIDKAQPVLTEATARYRETLDPYAAFRPEVLPGIGRDLFGWLDRDRTATAWMTAGGLRTLAIAVDSPDSEAAKALLDAPWEVLASDTGFLAEDAVQPFAVVRALGATGAPREPDHRDLHTLFMAAAPEGVQELDHEAEEAAILTVTERLDLRLVVEESGSAEVLPERIKAAGPFELVHLSCHGTIDEDKGPVLALETLEGDPDLVTAPDLLEALGARLPALVFLSACRTAEGTAEPFVRAMIRAGVANALGWDGSVIDGDAMAFAAALYHRLAAGDPVPRAAALARQAVLARHRADPEHGRHWHLARLYVGPGGGGVLCDGAKPARPFRENAGYREFLDKEREQVPVASARAFVGRRRQAQAVLRAFRDDTAAGVLIHGMGNLGKSSLAARVANRRLDLTTVVVFKDYDAAAVFERLVGALSEEKEENWGIKERWQNHWSHRIAAKPSLLENALEAMLKGPFRDRPILLIIDDLERTLEDPQPGEARTPVKAVYRDVLTAVIRAFDDARGQTPSRLLLTSRFTVTLPDGRGGDWADRLAAVPLPPMDARQQAKQWRAARTLDGGGIVLSDEAESLLGRILAAAAGNPGLQDLLSRPLLAGETEAAKAAVAAVNDWKASGDAPAEANAAFEFFRRVSFETYGAALTDAQRKVLRAGTLFNEGLPVPRAALVAAGEAAGVADAEVALARLLGLGLVDDWGRIGGHPHAAVNPLARPLAGDFLTEAEIAALADAAIGPLAEAWRRPNGHFPQDPRALEAARLALAAPNTDPAVLDAAALAATALLFNGHHDARAARAIHLPALARLRAAGVAPSAGLLHHAAKCAERLGETADRIAFLEEGLRTAAEGSVIRAQISGDLATATAQTDPDRALTMLREAAATFETLKDDHSRAVTLGRIADILRARGDLDEALRIRTEEELPAYRRLGAVREIAMTMYDIAHILTARGDLDGALRTIQDDVLPVFERLGHVREKAVTLGKIADILRARGEGDEALRIHLEDRLPVAQSMHDIDSVAHIRYKCAMIRIERGGLEHGEAQTVYDELAESFAISMKIGRVDYIAPVGAALGQVLMMGGYFDDAIPVLEAAAAAFEKLGWDDGVRQVRDLIATARRLQAERDGAGG